MLYACMWKLKWQVAGGKDFDMGRWCNKGPYK
jgi:hypothetical protein